MNHREYVQRKAVRADAESLFSEHNFMENQVKQHHRAVKALPYAQAASILLAAPVVVWVMMIFLPDFSYARYILLAPAAALLWAFERLLKEPKIGEFVKDHIRWGFRGEERLAHLDLKPVRINLGVAACSCIIFSILATCTGAMLFTYQQSNLSEEIADRYTTQRALTETTLQADTAAINRDYAAKIAAVTAEEERYRKRVSYKGRIDIHNETNRKRFADYTQQKADLRAERSKALESRTAKLSPTLTRLNTAEREALDNNTDHTRRNVLIMLLVSLLVEGTIISCLYNKYDCLAYIWLDNNLSASPLATSRQPLPTTVADNHKYLSDRPLAMSAAVRDNPVSATIPVPTDRTVAEKDTDVVSVSELPDVDIEEQPDIVMSRVGTYIDTTKKNFARAFETKRTPESRAKCKARVLARIKKLRAAGLEVEIDFANQKLIINR